MSKVSKVGDRLQEAPSNEVMQYLSGPRITDERDNNFSYMCSANDAQVVMLERQGIIENDVARTLLSAIEAIRNEGPEMLEIDPAREDFYYNFEYAVSKRTSPAIGGQLHTGRSRNDLGAAITRMRLRDVLAEILQAVFDLRRSLLECAEREAGTILPGHTHLQPAQPITVGHYMTGIAEALEGDTSRLFGALQRTNRSPLGAAALAGTGFDVNREMVADLLGFDGLCINTLNAVAQRDFFLESLAAGSVAGTLLSRFAQDLYVWYSDEFRVIGFRDRVSATSSIMPQKKNPVLLEAIKGRTAHQLGAFVSAIAGVRNNNFTNLVDANRLAFQPAWPALRELDVCLRLAVAAVENMTLNRELMAERAAANFSTVTQLADTLVRMWGVSFRDAHEVVGGVVRRVVDRGRRADAIDAALVREVAAELLDAGEELALSDADVRKALDPRLGIEARSLPGGPGAASVAAMITQQQANLEADSARLSEFRGLLRRAEERLAEEVRRVRA